jgi:pilus assembly protein CpaE
VAKQKVLVVDDDEGVLRLVELILKRAGYQIIKATTGEEGVQKVRTEKPDLVVMDVMMPGIGGFEATKRIRRLPEGRHIPIIFLSSLDQTAAKIKGLRIGADDYVAKPVRVGELLARIEVHLRPEAPPHGQLITVFGSRAGVGTTTLTVNLALALQRVSQKSVLLVDWRRPLGDVALFLGLPKKRALESLLPRVSNLDEQGFEAALENYVPDVWVLPGATDLASADQMNREALKHVLEIALIRAAYILVDGGPFFSWEAPPLVAKGKKTAALDELTPELTLCVLTPELASIERTAKAMGAPDVSVNVFWLLLNRCDLPGGISREQVESRLGIPLKGYVPNESGQMTRALNEGRPLYVADPRSDFSRAMDDIAARIREALAS